MDKAIIIKIPKKGDLSNCENWRAITLLSATSKIITILDGLKPEIKS